MNFTDLLIIYFSIGAPFGVYSYFQNRSELYQNDSLLKAVFPFLFWFPTAFELLKNKTFSRNTVSASGYKERFTASAEETKLYSVQKQLEKKFQKSSCKISIYEFREILERYAGLTIACKNQNSAAGDTGSEFFKIAQNKNVELAAKCFDRRNRARLFFHQSSARQDFLQLTTSLFTAVSDKHGFAELASEFADLLEDAQARNEIEKMIVENSFAEKHFALKSLETNLWKPETRKPPNANSTLNLLQTATPTRRLQKKD